ncbi:CopG family transcriptional regulator [alpha proteobacterium AAP81b]|nr:CopG family transcriptional regulator [alpha proteobacterium AAP81b]
MATRVAETVTVDLGEFAERAAARVREGGYESLSEVIRAGLEALDREDAAFDEVIRAAVAEARADPRPPVPIDQAFAEVYAYIASRRQDG